MIEWHDGLELKVSMFEASMVPKLLQASKGWPHGSKGCTRQLQKALGTLCNNI